MKGVPSLKDYSHESKKLIISVNKEYIEIKDGMSSLMEGCQGVKSDADIIKNAMKVAP